MIREYKKMIGTPILSQQKGEKLGIIQDIIIDPDRGKVEAFWVKTPKSPLPYPILQTQDILEWKRYIYVKDEKVFADPSQVIRIKEILGTGRLIMGNKVQSEAGTHYGKVTNLSFTDDTYYLNQILAQKSFLGLFARQKHLFPASRIIEVLPRTILVNDETRKKSPVILPTALIEPKTPDPAGYTTLGTRK